MTALLSKYAIGAFVTACLIGGLFYAGVRYADNMRELEDARDRTETRDTVEDLENEAENDSDDALADSISDVQ